MALLTCGINHKTAPLALRERMVFAPEIMPEPLVDLLKQTSVREAAILSTCNRTELYCESDDVDSVIHWLQNHHKLSGSELNPCLYVHRDAAMVRHILRVASGLDSMVLGEPQIFGQVKTAVSFAHAAGTLGKQLRRLFHYVFSVSKAIRTQTAIGNHPISIAFAAVEHSKHIFADLSQTNVLLIGAGEMIELAARHLQAAGVKNFYVANRTLGRAEKLAQQIQGHAVILNNVPELLNKIEIVMTATASQLPIIGKGMVERAFKTRKHKPMFMVDLAVPRDIEPEVGELADVYLYTIDDLHAVIQKNLQHRQAAANQAELIIDDKTTHYMQSLKILETVPMIRSYRDKASHLRDVELHKAKRLLKNGFTPEETLERLARDLTNKLLHAPTVQLRHAAYEQRHEILALAKELFGVE